MEKNIALQLIEEKNYVKAKDELLKLNVVDIANLLTQLEDDDLIKAFRLMPKDIAADIFSYLPKDTARELLVALSVSEASAIIDDLYADDATDVLEEMPANIVTNLLSLASDETRKNINSLLQYPDSSAGSIMTVEYVDIKSVQTVDEAIAKIRAEGIDKETINTIYVLDTDRKLLGIISLRRLLLANPQDVIGNIMYDPPAVVSTLTDQEEVVQTISKYDIAALPVVDSEHRMVGIITVDDVVDILQEETSEDMAKMAAVTPSDQPYLKRSVFRIYLDRAPWLLILLVSAIFTGMIITANENLLKNSMFAIVLTASIPMLMDSGGNAGSQANVTVIRGMVLGDIMPIDFLKVMWKELKVSLLLGLTLAVTCFGKLMLVDQTWRVSGGFTVALVISLSLFITIVIAKIVGSLMPMIAKKLKLDPAVVASPFITTIVDAIALIIYCQIAIGLLP